MACDACGKTGTSLSDLRSIYMTSEVKAVCPDCEKIINKQLGKLQTATSNIQISLLKRFVNVLHSKWTQGALGKKNPAPQPPSPAEIIELAKASGAARSEGYGKWTFSYDQLQDFTQKAIHFDKSVSQHRKNAGTLERQDHDEDKSGDRK